MNIKVKLIGKGWAEQNKIVEVRVTGIALPGGSCFGVYNGFEIEQVEEIESLPLAPPVTGLQAIFGQKVREMTVCFQEEKL